MALVLLELGAQRRELTAQIVHIRARRCADHIDTIQVAITT